MKLRQEHIAIGIIMIAASLLRLYHFSEWSLTNDELSAWLRLQHGSFDELIEQGVRPDFHPAGIQVFLYHWTKVAGDSPFALRIPFVIFGILAAGFTYLLGKKWFGTQAALMSAAAMCVLQLPLLYSQIARPYASGSFFALGMAYFWTRVLWDEKPSWKSSTGLALFIILNLYNHYFSVLFAGFLGLTGLFFLNRKNMSGYLIAGTISILSFLPHLDISMEQLSRGGLDSWLGKPGSAFMDEFLQYNIYGSPVFGIILISLILAPLGIKYFARELNRFHFISLGLFVGTFLTAWFYSLYVNPVLQQSILIFTFPFLVMFLFSFWGEGNHKLQIAGVLLVLIPGTVSIFHSGFYRKEQFAVFEDLVQESISYAKKAGNTGCTVFYNAIAPEYPGYYYDRIGAKKDFLFSRGDSPSFLSDLQRAVEEARGETFIYAWTNNRHPEEAYPIILRKFPKLLENNAHFNSQWSAFGKTPVPASCYFRDIPDTNSISPKNEFAEYLQLTLDSLPAECHYIGADLEYSDPAGKGEIVLVSEIRRDDSLLLWKGANSINFRYADSLGVLRLHLVLKRDSTFLPTDHIKFYLWNKDKNTFRPRRLTIYSTDLFNPLIHE